MDQLHSPQLQKAKTGFTNCGNRVVIPMNLISIHGSFQVGITRTFILVVGVTRNFCSPNEPRHQKSSNRSTAPTSPHSLARCSATLRKAHTSQMCLSTRTCPTT